MGIEAKAREPELPCAGYKGCHELEGVMYDFFIHDPACPKSPEQRCGATNTTTEKDSVSVLRSE